MTVDSSPTEQRFIERLGSLNRLWNELVTAATSLDLCRLAVERGIEVLGIGRLAIWLIDDDPLKPRGSFGTDENGRLRDERDVRLSIGAASLLGKVLSGVVDLEFVRDSPLRNHQAQVVGTGTQAVVAIHDGQRVIGALTGDDLLNDQPLRLHDVEVLRLYGSSLGHLLARQRAIEAKASIDAHYRAVVEHADERIVVIDRKGTIEFLNRVDPPGRIEDVLGLNIYDLAFPDQVELLRRTVNHVFTTGEPTELEIIGHGPGGQRQWFAGRIGPIPHNGRIDRAVVTCANIHNLKTAEEALLRHQEDLEEAVQTRTAELAKTNQALRDEVKERVRAESALRKSEQRFRLLAENVPGVIYLCRNDDRYSMLYLNDGVEEVTGYPKEMFLHDQLSFVELYHPEDTPVIGPIVEEAIAQRKRFVLHYRIRHRSGAWRWIEEHGVGVFDGDRLLMLEGYLHDVTDRREAELALRDAHDQLERRVAERTEALTEANEKLQSEVLQRRAAQEKIQHHQMQLRSLASQLMLAEERERRRIAADVHDHVGQTLSLAQIKLHAVMRENLSPRGQAAFDEAKQLLDNAIADTRNLIFDLSPPVLYDLGLRAAIEWLVDRYNATSDVDIRVRCHTDGKHPAEAVSVLLFRSVRELLVNAIKYARATRVRVIMRDAGDSIEITVADDGIGIEPAAVASAPDRTGGFGLFNMRQQLEQIGGGLQIGASENGGASVTITAPLMADTCTKNGGTTNDDVHSAG